MADVNWKESDFAGDIKRLMKYAQGDYMMAKIQIENYVRMRSSSKEYIIAALEELDGDTAKKLIADLSK